MKVGVSEEEEAEKVMQEFNPHLHTFINVAEHKQ